MVRLGRIYPENGERRVRGVLQSALAGATGRPNSGAEHHSFFRIAVVLLIAATAALGAGASRGSAATGLPAASSPSGTAQPDAAGTVWLCRPGMAHNPCLSSLDATVIQANGASTIRHLTPSVDSPFDCFFLYPTVSTETTDNSDLTIQPVELAAAEALAAPFSQVCRIWAPMYRQETATMLQSARANDAQTLATAYQSVLAAWQDYLANDNVGRPIVFVGHSQGSSMLIKLLQNQIDPNVALRKQLVSAILPGGNVVVPIRPGAQGSFAHLIACRSVRQVGCVIAYSTFPSQPPADSLFGRPGQGASEQTGQTATTGVRVMCVNPAALGGGSAVLDTFVPVSMLQPGAKVTTPWIEFPSLYSATCTSANGASWLNVVGTSQKDARPQVAAAYAKSKGPTWGFHGLDIPLAVGNLVSDVLQQEAAYKAH